MVYMAWVFYVEQLCVDILGILAKNTVWLPRVFLLQRVLICMRAALLHFQSYIEITEEAAHVVKQKNHVKSFVLTVKLMTRN